MYYYQSLRIFTQYNDCASKETAFQRSLSILFRLLDIINGRREDLKEIIAILLDNAARHVNKNGIITVSVREASSGQRIIRKNSSIEICVSNTGSTISENDLPHIFDRFYKADTECRVSNSYGLGLSIAKALAEKNGFYLSVTSEDMITEFSLIVS